jgi:alpha-glucosidase
MIGKDLVATPIIEPNTTTRRIYLPNENWHDFHNGKWYQNGTHEIANVTLTDKIPLFIREGAGVLVQETKSVLQIKDLTNSF